MTRSTLRPFSNLLPRKSGGRGHGKLILSFLFGVLLSTPALRAQQGDVSSDPNPQTARAMQQRIDQLEARLKEVEAALAKVTATQPSPAPAQGVTPGVAVPPPPAA